MVARPRDSNKIIALVFIALLAGHECGRISEHSTLASNIQEHLEIKEFGSRQNEKTTSPFFWMHNDVCRPNELHSKDSSAASKRYLEKFDRIEKVIEALKDEKCIDMKGCHEKWVEMQSRLRHFASCSELKKQQGKRDANPESVTQLKKVLHEHNHALMKVYTDGLTVIGMAMKKNNMFPPGKLCNFFPSKLNITFALDASKTDPYEAKRTMREQMFGKHCDEAAAEEYLNSLPEKSKCTAQAIMDVVDRTVGLAEHVNANPPSNKEELKKLAMNAAVDTKKIVKEAMTSETDDADPIDNEPMEIHAEQKEALEDGGSAPSVGSSALVALSTAELTRALTQGQFTWWEFIVGIVVIILIQALIGAAGGPLLVTFQEFYYASIGSFR